MAECGNVILVSRGGCLYVCIHIPFYASRAGFYICIGVLYMMWECYSRVVNIGGYVSTCLLIHMFDNIIDVYFGYTVTVIFPIHFFSCWYMFKIFESLPNILG